MAFSWDGRFVLRAIDEEDPDVYRIFLHSDDPSHFTDAVNIIDQAPVKASKKLFGVRPVNPPVPWYVRLAGTNDVLMGVFQLNDAYAGSARTPLWAALCLDSGDVVFQPSQNGSDSRFESLLGPGLVHQAMVLL